MFAVALGLVLGLVYAGLACLFVALCLLLSVVAWPLLPLVLHPLMLFGKTERLLEGWLDPQDSWFLLLYGCFLGSWAPFLGPFPCAGRWCLAAAAQGVVCLPPIEPLLLQEPLTGG